MMAFESELKRVAEETEALLAELIGTVPASGEIFRPQRLVEAMRHGALGGGKRLRPFLVVAGAQALGGERAAALRAGAGIELLHCYSLVHDDLPSMDNDDLRRGRPTVHRAFDEATAILAGDALQTLAFAVMADPATHGEATIRAELTLGLARAAGLGGMAGGQMLDLAAEGRFDGGMPKALTEQEIRRLQAMKTGALIAFSAEAGAIVAGAAAEQRAGLRRYGEIIGLAFQIADDILDVTQTSEQLGKTAGKDLTAEKVTYPALYGLQKAEQMATDLISRACAALDPFGPRADTLKSIATYLVERKK
jgi:farnesyl diphosphate synthase